MMRSNMIFFSFLFLLLTISFTAQNLFAIKFEDAAFPELVSSGRANAMGNAFVCRVDDASSPFYNPAGLGSVRITHFHISNFHLETNQALVDASTGGNMGAMAINLSKAFNTDGSRQLLLSNRGKIIYNRINAMPNITTRYMSMGYLFSKQSRLTIKEAEGSPFEYAMRQDHGPYWGLTISLFGGIIKLGATIIMLNRDEIIGEQPYINETTEIKSDDYQKGTMMYYVGGFRLVLPFAWLPTLSVVKHNANAAPFKNGRGAGVPDPIKENLVVGVSLTPQLGKFVRLNLELNYKDAQNSYKDVSTQRKVTAGMEFDLARKMFVRFGYGDGFGSYGVGIKGRKLEFDLTSYAVDNTDGIRGEEDRRYSVTISSGF